MTLRLSPPLSGDWNKRITGTFGYRAAIPSQGVPAGGHTGLDIADKRGVPIGAMLPGKVIRIWDDYFMNGIPAGGRMIAVRHAGGYETRYAHLSRYARRHLRKIRVGDVVRRNDVLGYVGQTGAATGDHVHVELLKNGRYLDPYPYIQEDPVTEDDIEKIANAVTRKLLTYPIPRSENPKVMTSLRGMISHQPERVLEVRANFATVRSLLERILKKLGA